MHFSAGLLCLAACSVQNVPAKFEVDIRNINGVVVVQSRWYADVNISTETVKLRVLIILGHEIQRVPQSLVMRTYFQRSNV